MHEAADAPDASLGLNHDLPGSLCRPLHESSTFQQSRQKDNTFVTAQKLHSSAGKNSTLSLTFHSVLTTGSLLVGTSSVAFPES